ncbi:MAG: hypothetical protein RLZZ28_567 [Bacteroidota bacterium]
MNKLVLLPVFACLSTTGFSQVKKPVPAPKPAAVAAKPIKPFKSSIDSISYAVGLRIAQSLKAQGFDSLNMAMFQKGMGDALSSKPALLSDDAITACISTYQQKVNAQKNAVQEKENAAKSAVAKKEGAAFLATNGKRPGVISLPSGVQYEVMVTGTDNTKATIASTIKFHYKGTLINGTVFDSSEGKEPVTYPLSQLIRGWQEVVPLMTVGSKWKVFIPSDYGYGDNPRPGGPIGPGDTLIFELELVGVQN